MVVVREELEAKIGEALQRGDYAETATLALGGYGAEIYGFLLAFHRDEGDAAEAFSYFSERLWRDLKSFRGESSFRTWAYMLARHASINYQRDARRRAKRLGELPDNSQISELAARARTETLSYLRSERRERFAALREALAPDDRALLVLRVDRGLSWGELARVLRENDGPQTDDDVKREAARLRKRFQLLKARLLELGRDAGVVSGGRD
jgi:RNA polymerase sigma-70 factor, ECF subfamily